MVGVAVNVTFVPEQIAVEFALAVTEGVILVVTVIVTADEVAVAGDAQVAFDVNTTVNLSLLAIVVVAYVELVAPLIVVPFLLH